MKKIDIFQANNISWKDYFVMIATLDKFILCDDMQFTKNDWRNQLKTPIQKKSELARN